MHDTSPGIPSPAADTFAAAEAAAGRRTGRRQALAAFGLAGAALAGSQTIPGLAQAAGPGPALAAPKKRLEAGAGYTSVDDLRASAGAADGEQVHVVGYHADRPGVGGGVFYWDADATETDDGGTVIAATGVATGRWKRPVEARVDLAWFGWTGVGDVDDAPKVRAAVAALPTGGIVETGPGKVRLESTVEITSIPILFQGAGATDVDDYSTQYIVATGAADGFRLKNVHGGGMRDLVVRGSGLTGGSLVATEAAGTDRNYMVSFINVRFKDGYNGMTLRSCNTIRFRNCVWNGFNGQYVILLNGVGDGSRADPVEFVQCGIAAGPANTGVDNLVIDGLGGSIKFFATAVLFGRHGIWLKNTTGGSYPKFLYFEGGGFENGHGYPVLLEAGAQAQFANVYVSADNELSNVRITEGFTGTATFTGCIIRGCGHNGLDVASTRVTVTGCVIGNNGRTAHPAFARTITGTSSGGGGKVRITTSTEHGWETGDRVSVLDVTGTTEANGKWTINVVSPTAFEIPVQFAHAYAGGGSAYRHGTGINIRSAATRVVVVGNAIGGLADGINRQDYGIVCASPDVLVADNDLNGNLVAPYTITGSVDGQTRFAGNKGVEQIDGRLVARVTGAVPDGLYDFGNLLYLDGQRIRVTKVTRKLGGGACDVRLDAAAASAGGNAIGVTTTSQTTALTSPFTVDGTGTSLRLQARVLNAASASDLEVQFAYQILG